MGAYRMASPLLPSMSLKSEFSMWRPSFPHLFSSWNVLPRFLVLAWQLRLTLDVWMLDCGSRITLGELASLQSAQHGAGGAVTRFISAITPCCVHNTFGHGSGMAITSRSLSCVANQLPPKFATFQTPPSSKPPYWPVGMGNASQHALKHSIFHPCSPSTIWMQFNHLQRFSHESRKRFFNIWILFLLLFSYPHKKLPINVDNTGKMHQTATWFAQLANALKWQNSQHTLLHRTWATGFFSFALAPCIS